MRGDLGGESLILNFFVLLPHQILDLRVQLICVVIQLLVGMLKVLNLPTKQLLRCHLIICIKLRHRSLDAKNIE